MSPNPCAARVCGWEESGWAHLGEVDDAEIGLRGLPDYPSFVSVNMKSSVSQFPAVLSETGRNKRNRLV